MRWSILLPTHDNPESLGFALDAALAQSETDFELLIVGDGVSDETRAVVARRVDPRITFHDLPKAQGFGYVHRRAVLAQALGDYISFMSDDDLVGPHHLRVLGAQLDAGTVFAYSRPMWCVPSGHVVPLSFDLGDAWIRGRFELVNYIPAVFVAVRRSALDQAGGWPVNVPSAADWMLWKAILAQPGARVGYDTIPTALHFRSKRRDSDHPLVEAILALPERERWWPEAARVPREERAQQGTAAELNTEQWWTELARAAVRIEHHVAATVGLAGALTDQAVREARADERQKFQSSTSWKLTRPLRRIATLLGRGRP
jgi:hypothetical protein